MYIAMSFAVSKLGLDLSIKSDRLTISEFVPPCFLNNALKHLRDSSRTSRFGLFNISSNASYSWLSCSGESGGGLLRGR